MSDECLDRAHRINLFETDLVERQFVIVSTATRLLEVHLCSPALTNLERLVMTLSSYSEPCLSIIVTVMQNASFGYSATIS